MFQSGVPDIQTMFTKRNVRGLIKTLQDLDQNRRNAAIEALGEVGDVQVVAPLLAILREEPFLVTLALVKMGGPGLDAVITAIQNPSWQIRWASAEALGTSSDPRAVDALIGVLQDSEARVVQSAIAALSQLGNARAVSALAALLASSDRAIRLTACQALGHLKDPSVTAQLLPLLQNADRNLRSAVVTSLDQLGWQPGLDEIGAAYWVARRYWSKCSEFGALAVPPLAVALQDEPQNAAEALERIGAPAVEPLTQALQNPNQDVCRAAATVLGRMGDARAVEPLMAALKTTDMTLRQIVIQSLGQLGDARAVDPLLASLQAPEAQVRQATIEALGQLGDARVVLPLLAALDDPEPKVRAAASITLGSLGALVVQPLISALRNPALRAGVVGTLGRIGAPAVRPLLATLQDPDAGVRRASLDALRDQSDLRKIGTPAIQPVLAALKDSQADVRRAAIEVLGYLGDPRAVEPLVAALKDEPVRYAAAWALEKIGVPPTLKSIISSFRKNEAMNTVGQLRDLCDAYTANDAAEIARLEPPARQIGEELNRRGGLEEMRNLFDQLGIWRGHETLAKLWIGIGDWQP
jgi:HEAT repeat protein